MNLYIVCGYMVCGYLHTGFLGNERVSNVYRKRKLHGDDGLYVHCIIQADVDSRKRGRPQ